MIHFPLLFGTVVNVRRIHDNAVAILPLQNLGSMSGMRVTAPTFASHVRLPDDNPDFV